MRWIRLFMNGIDTGYYVSDNGDIRLDEEIISGDVIKVDDHYVKVNRHYLVAYCFDINPKQKESITIGHNFYTDKTVVAKAIMVEMEHYRTKRVFKGTEEQKVHLACEMLANPEIRPIYVHKITDIPRHDLQLLWEGKKWNDISQQYVFPIRKYTPLKNEYKEGQIHEVCAMLENNIDVRLISTMSGVDVTTIHRIQLRALYQTISMWYEFYIVNSFRAKDQMMVTNQQVRQACALLENPEYDYKFIADFCNIDLATLFNIRDKKIYQFISEDFDVSTLRYGDTDPAYPLIIELMANGWSFNEIVGKVQLEFDTPNRKQVEKLVKLVRQKYFSV